MKEKRSAVDQAEVYWGEGDTDAKFGPETWAYYYADPLLDLARHAEAQYGDDLVFRRLLKEIENV